MCKFVISCKLTKQNIKTVQTHAESIYVLTILPFVTTWLYSEN